MNHTQHKTIPIPYFPKSERKPTLCMIKIKTQKTKLLRQKKRGPWRMTFSRGQEAPSAKSTAGTWHAFSIVHPVTFPRARLHTQKLLLSRRKHTTTFAPYFPAPLWKRDCETAASKHCPLGAAFTLLHPPLPSHGHPSRAKRQSREELRTMPR